MELERRLPVGDRVLGAHPVHQLALERGVADRLDDPAPRVVRADQRAVPVRRDQELVDLVRAGAVADLDQRIAEARPVVAQRHLVEHRDADRLPALRAEPPLTAHEVE